MNLARQLEVDSKDASGRARLSVRVDWKLESEAKAIKSCSSGKTSGIAVSLRALQAKVPELAAVELPFLFADYAAVDRAMAAARPMLSSLLRDQGFVLALRLESGFAHWASKTSLLLRRESFAGRAMRSWPSSVSQAIYQALGAAPQPIDGVDVAESLASGRVDGYDHSLHFGRLAEWSRQIRFVTLSSHAYQVAGLVWCGAWFDSLPEELKALLTRRDARIEALERAGLELQRVFNDTLMPKQYERAGIALGVLDRDQRSALEAALDGVEQQFLDATSPAGRELLAVLKKSRR